jgi:hypothetical protein
VSGARPRQLVHRGSVLAAGMVFDTRLLGENVARARVIASWTAESWVGRVGSKLVLVVPSVFRVDADAVGGAPLVAVGEILSAAPLDASDARAIEAQAADPLVLVEAGRFKVVPKGEVAAEDPSSWIDLSAFRAIDVESLSDEPAAILVAPPVAAPRDVLGISAAPPEREDALRAFAAASKGETAVSRREKASSRAASARRSLRGIPALFRFLAMLAASFVESPASPPAGKEPPTHSGEEASARGLPWARLRDWFHRLALRMLVVTRLSELIGAKQAAYLRETLALFERGEFHEALRRAIPIGRAADEGSSRVALGTPKRRSDLAISMRARRATSMFVVADAAHAYMRTTYRAAFERLVALGRLEEAAFVLAELLQDDAQAVSFLEGHGKLRLAAELAEARKLSPGVIVRQWVIAGDIARAVRIARRTGAFADAIARLEQRRPSECNLLRVSFAEQLASAGDYGAAADAVWPVVAARGLAKRWLDLAIDAGGPAGAAALVRKAILAPASLPDVLSRARAFLRPDGSEILREAFAKAVANERAEDVRILARAAARDLLTMRSMPQAKRRSLLDRLVELSYDDALRVDLPALSSDEPVVLHTRATPRVHRFRTTRSSSSPVHDAVRLPNGRTLVAFGEAGVRLLTPDGRTAAFFDEPAYALVVSDRGDRALALAPRGEVSRVARIDLVQHRAHLWCDVRLQGHAPTFDGAEWFVTQNGSVLAIDALDDSGFHATWSVRPAEAETDSVGAIARSEKHLIVEVLRFGTPELWSIELPSLTLRARVPWKGPSGVFFVREAVTDPASVVSWLREMDVSDDSPPSSVRSKVHIFEPLRASATNFSVEETLFAEATDEPALAADGLWVAFAEKMEGGVACTVVDRELRIRRARVELEGAEQVTLRIFAGTLTVIADGYEVTHLDLGTGDVERVTLRPGR